MPITQDRIHILLQAAERALEAFESLQGLIQMEYDQARKGQQSFEQAFNALAMHINGLVPHSAQATVGQERLRYSLTLNKNRRDRDRKQRQRGGSGRNYTAPAATGASASPRPRTAAEVAAELEREEAATAITDTESESGLFNVPPPKWLSEAELAEMEEEGNKALRQEEYLRKQEAERGGNG